MRGICKYHAHHPADPYFRMAETHGGQYVNQFARQMYLQLGMRVLVFSAHHDTSGALSLSQ